MTAVKEVMTRQVATIEPETTLADAAKKMRQLDCGSLPICEGKGHMLLGIVTDRDITVRAVAEGRDPNRTPVREIMSSDLVCIAEDRDTEQAATLMSTYQVRRLPVVDPTNHVIGMLSLGKLARTDNGQRTAQVLKDISERRTSRKK
ncbi:MAG: CBS domain-containing protein [Planctomycetes bacterium]|nr:CBS domain-containing protein [Planctomycetota bacterium]